MHKKGITEEIAKKRSRKTVKSQRGIVGASLDQINARRNQKPEVRAAARSSALAKSKEDKKARAEARKTEKAKVRAAIHRDGRMLTCASSPPLPLAAPTCPRSPSRA